MQSRLLLRTLVVRLVLFKVSSKIASIFIDCLTPNSVQGHRNSTNCPQPSPQPAFLFFRRQRFVVLHLYEHLHLSAFGSNNAQADLNRDGIVDDSDLLLVLFNFGSGC